MALEVRFPLYTLIVAGLRQQINYTTAYVILLHLSKDLHIFIRLESHNIVQQK